MPPAAGPEFHPGVVVVAVGPVGGIALPGRDADRPQGRHQQGGFLPTAAPGAAAHAQGGKGAVVREGSDLTVIACGIMVHKAIEAARLLEKKGVSVRVVDMYSIKPIDAELIVRCARETGAIVCAEEHNIFGGLGSAVAEVLAHNACGVPTEFVGIQDVFTESAPYGELLHKYGLDAEAVCAAAEKVLARK